MSVKNIHWWRHSWVHIQINWQQPKLCYTFQVCVLLHRFSYAVYKQFDASVFPCFQRIIHMFLCYSSFTSWKPTMFLCLRHMFLLTDNLYHGRWMSIDGCAADPGHGKGCGTTTRVSRVGVLVLFDDVDMWCTLWPVTVKRSMLQSRSSRATTIARKTSTDQLSLMVHQSTNMNNVENT
jgi:hypothetical protein